MKKFTLLCLLLTCFYSCVEKTKNAETEETAPKVVVTVSEQEKAINQIVKDAYAYISFEKGTTPDYKVLKSIFMPNATLYNFRGDSLQSFLIDDFINGFKGSIDNKQMLAFNEVELGGETEYFGNVGHRISAYGSYFDGSTEIGEKGVNSFQVLKVNGKWLINSIIWDVEKEGQAIPERYLDDK